ncbi:flagellar export protein FliJ [Massilia solisilvae]|uniref:Flagellar FliJ protein n=1 Tax=Massilia solisilvae TaxID=1811225 RepID=A0ABT2BEV3_9BURK|nr:flagellar export protein FliJ [Massilia solisilvae]MCS0607041.1 flagellar export protein FliJ [Massilia solisilvae]
MANPSALDTLTDLAQRESDEAAKRVGAARRTVEEAQQKLQMLLGYRDEYAQRLDAVQMAGITPHAYHNFVAFVGKLDHAIAGQQEVLRHAEARTALEQKAWQQCERKRLSYRTLSERAAREALRVENKRDQKLMDDHAARTVYYKR